MKPCVGGEWTRLAFVAQSLGPSTYAAQRSAAETVLEQLELAAFRDDPAGLAEWRHGQMSETALTT